MFYRVALVCLSLTALPPSAPMAQAQSCGFKVAFVRPDEGGKQTVKVFEAAPIAALGGVRPLLFVSRPGLKVNTDGTLRSYHQVDITGRACVADPTQTHCAFNNIRNAYRDQHRPESDFVKVRDAGYPLGPTWNLLSDQIIEADKTTKKPCITADGFLVSMTADVAVPGGFGQVGNCDQSKWIDPMRIPAIVMPKSTPALPSQFTAKGVVKRNLVVALSDSASHRMVPGIVGDVGPADELGEATVAMNRALNGMPSTDEPKHRKDAIERFQAGPTAILMLPGPANVVARPLSADSIRAAGEAVIAKIGGVETLRACIRQEVDPAF